MRRDADRPELIALSFGMESSASLWNVVFEGFDQEVVLVSRFAGKDDSVVGTLYEFGDIIGRNYRECKVRATRTGIEIKKPFPRNDVSLVNEWTGLMESIREEMTQIHAGRVDTGCGR
ncbi:MAG: hypothetical protein AB1598_09395 [Thermodesulfobacteriota bacterium]